jgi:hypothetical protein
MTLRIKSRADRDDELVGYIRRHQPVAPVELRDRFTETVYQRLYRLVGEGRVRRLDPSANPRESRYVVA